MEWAGRRNALTTVNAYLTERGCFRHHQGRKEKTSFKTECKRCLARRELSDRFMPDPVRLRV